MALKLITNSVEQNTAQMAVTNSSNAEVASDNVYNVGGGQRYVGYASATTGVRTLNYVNTAGTLSADTVVVTNASRIDGHYVAAKSYSAYPGTSSVVASETLSGTFVGQKETDWVKAFSSAQSGKQAFGLQLGQAPTDDGGGFVAACGKVYFGSAFTLNYPQTAQMTPLPLDSRLLIHRQSYLVNESWVFTADRLTRADVQTFKRLHKTKHEPIFLWDENGTHVGYKLLHGILVSYKDRADFHDTYSLQLTIASLKTW